MQTLQKKTLHKAVALLVNQLKTVNIDTNLWWEMLSDLDDESFKKAVLEIINGSEEIYPGTNLIAVIRKKVAGGTKALLPAEAWGAVLAAVHSIGSYGNPFFEDPLIMKAVEGVGWRNICLSDNIGVERAHFIRFYETLVHRAEQDRALGLIDSKSFDRLGNNSGGKLALP